MYHAPVDRKSTRLNSSHLGISYAVFCLKKMTERAGTDADPGADTPSGWHRRYAAWHAVVAGERGGLRDRVLRRIEGETPLFFFNDTATTEIYTLSLHDALPI